MAHELPPCWGRDLVKRLFPGQVLIPANNNEHANPGLVFDRYLRIWYETRSGLQPKNHEETDRGDADPGRARDLQEFCDAYKATGRMGKGIVAMTHRRLEALACGKTQEPARTRTYSTRWRIVSGLGTDHPLENGFVFDRSSGAPYFPGSSVKGLCRAAARNVLGMPRTEEDDLFGVDPGAKQPSLAAGSLTFLPAYPAKDHWPELEVDVVNNHHPTYYRDLNSPSSKVRGPGETDSPIPVFFLTVAANTPFTFRICGRDTQVTDAMIERAFECLEVGLDYLGLGAKTAAGYGTFEVP